MNENPIKALYVGTIDIAGMKLQCAVLEDERRVLTENAVLKVLGSRSGASKRIKYEARDKGRVPLPLFLSPKSLKPYIDKYLQDGPLEPIIYQHKTADVIAFDCRLLPKICRIWIEAALNGHLQSQQMPKTMNALSILSGFGELGIIGLVDEATGYQEIRDKRALAAILELYIAKELQPWTKTFPYEFYNQIFRLKGWPGPDGVKRPSVIGHYTNDIVYARLERGVLDELKRLNPPIAPGRRKHKNFQWLTGDVGHPKLREHLIGVTALMRAASNWDGFRRALARAYPKRLEGRQLALGDDE